MPSVIANSALFGGSQVTSAKAALPASFEDLYSIPAGDEALVVVDLYVDSQFSKSGSAISPEPSRLVARQPLLYQRNTDHAALLEMLDAGHRKANAPQARPQRAVSSNTVVSYPLRVGHERVRRA